MAHGVTRSIPAPAKIQIVMGSFSMKLSWILFAAAMSLGIVAVKMSDLSPIYPYVYGELRSVEGAVTGSYYTNASVDEEPVMATIFTFENAAGFTYENVSFQIGFAYQEGQTVTVRYPSGYPQHAYIEGMKTAEFHMLFLLCLLIPLGVALFIVLRIKRGLKDLHLLTHGIMTGGKLIEKKATGTEINDQMVYKLTFEFSDAIGKRYRHEVKTHVTEQLEDDEEERLFYLKDDPNRATMVDDLPGAPVISQKGEIERLGSSSLITTIALPLANIVGFAWYFFA
jgi:hypothetical protein|tara:strand:+ start:8804 stop:9652 length:849 start_codon:yes stop_codon:yes gene_type:complete